MNQLRVWSSQGLVIAPYSAGSRYVPHVLQMVLFPVLEAKPVPECKECVRPLPACLLVLVPAVRPGVAGDDDRLVHRRPHATLDFQCHRIGIKELEHLLQLDLPCKLLEHHDLAARIREPSACSR